MNQSGSCVVRHDLLTSGLLERSDDEANNGDIVSSYRDTFVESGSACDKQYKYLPPGFTQQYLAWIPLGFTRQVEKTV